MFGSARGADVGGVEDSIHAKEVSASDPTLKRLQAALHDTHAVTGLETRESTLEQIFVDLVQQRERELAA